MFGFKSEVWVYLQKFGKVGGDKKTCKKWNVLYDYQYSREKSDEKRKKKKQGKSKKKQKKQKKEKKLVQGKQLRAAKGEPEGDFAIIN